MTALTWTKTTAGRYSAVSADGALRYVAQRVDTIWDLRVWSTDLAVMAHPVDTAGIEFDTLAMAKACSQAYEDNVLATEKPYLGRMTRAVLAAYS